jgi:mono/diheme cytochrome c family protein
MASAAAAEDRIIREEHPGYPYYRQYCASCHGVFADGLGPVVPALRTRPPDLTRLAEKYGTPLPQAAIRDFIDGEVMVRAHGQTDMPIWGRQLRRELPATPVPAKKLILNVIVDYLAAIQRAGE